MKKCNFADGYYKTWLLILIFPEDPSVSGLSALPCTFRFPVALKNRVALNAQALINVFDQGPQGLQPINRTVLKIN